MSPQARWARPLLWITAPMAIAACALIMMTEFAGSRGAGVAYSAVLFLPVAALALFARGVPASGPRRWAVAALALLPLLASAWSPWLDCWWPTRQEVTALPSAPCSAGPAEWSGTGDGPSILAERSTGESAGWQCSWNSPDRAGILAMRFQLFQRSGFRSGTALAHHSLNVGDRPPYGQLLPGADEATVLHTGIVSFRRANVQVTITTSLTPPEQDRMVVELARKSLSMLVVED